MNNVCTWSGARSVFERLIIGAALVIMACFSNVPLTSAHTLEVAALGEGNGVITSTPAGIDCPDDCTHDYADGTDVTLTATADGNSTFSVWSGACLTNNPCNFRMNSDRVFTATFDKRTSRITVSTTGNGEGTISSSPSGITCPGTCSASFDVADNVVLTPAASAGSEFVSWTGPCKELEETKADSFGGWLRLGPRTENTCTILVDSATSAAARFDLLSFLLTVTVEGLGSGKVTSNIPGISCPSICERDFQYDREIILTAVSGDGSVFAGWSGACSGDGTCAVNMTEAKNVTATFDAIETASLTVAPVGNGQGTVTSSPERISCPATCTAEFPVGADVTLTPVSGVDSTFVRWNDALCAPFADDPCTLQMDADATVIPVFSKPAKFPSAVPPLLLAPGEGE